MEIKMEHFVNGSCLVCGADILSDGNEPYSMEVEEGKIYLCPVCGEGFSMVLGLMGIQVTIKQVVIGEPEKKEIEK